MDSSFYAEGARKLVSEANLTAQISVPVLYDSPPLFSHSNMIQLFQKDTKLNRVESTSMVIKQVYTRSPSAVNLKMDF